MMLAEALRAAALSVEQHKATLAWSGPEMTPDEGRALIIAGVSALGHEFGSLAAASQTAQVYPRGVEAVRREVRARGSGSPTGRTTSLSPGERRRRLKIASLVEPVHGRV